MKIERGQYTFKSITICLFSYITSSIEEQQEHYGSGGQKVEEWWTFFIVHLGVNFAFAKQQYCYRLVARKKREREKKFLVFVFKIIVGVKHFTQFRCSSASSQSN